MGFPPRPGAQAPHRTLRSRGVQLHLGVAADRAIDAETGMTSLFIVSAARRPWGAEASLRRLLPALVEAYDAVTVFVPTPETAVVFQDIAGVEVKLAYYVSRLQYLVEIGRLMRTKDSGSHVLVFSLQLVPLVLPLRILRPNMKVLVDLHDAPRNPVDLHIVRVLLPMFHRIVAISRYVQAHFRTSRAVVVPRPIEPVEHRDRHASATLTLGVAGRVDREKEIELAIAVTAALPALRLIVFGAGLVDGDDYLDELERLAANQAPGRVTFAGRVSPEQIFSRIDILFVGNRNEPSGRTVGEAMWAGLPVVTPSTGGSSEFYEDGVSGLQYTAGSLSSALEAVTQLLDRDNRERIGRAAEEQMRTSRDPRQLAHAYALALRGKQK